MRRRIQRGIFAGGARRLLHLLELIKRGEFLERTESEPGKEVFGRTVEPWTPGKVGDARDFDESAVEKLFKGVRDAYAANRFDIGAGGRLLVRDNDERFEDSF